MKQLPTLFKKDLLDLFDECAMFMNVDTMETKAWYKWIEEYDNEEAILEVRSFLLDIEREKAGLEFVDSKEVDDSDVLEEIKDRIYELVDLDVG